MSRSVAELRSELQGARDGSRTYRRGLMDALERLDGPDATAALMEVLAEDPARSLRSRAALMLAERRDPRSESGLLRAAEADEEEAVRLNAIKALGRMGSTRAVPLLTELLGHPKMGARLIAINALVCISGDEARERGLAALADERAWVRGIAARKLVRTGDPRAISAVRDLARSSGPRRRRQLERMLNREARDLPARR